MVQDCNSGPLPLRMSSKSFPVCVLDHAGVADGKVSKAEVGQAVSLWRYLQHEQAYIDTRFAEFDMDSDAQLQHEELKLFLTALNDDIPVTDKEAEWVMAQTDKDHSGGLDKTELRAAVALWYPTVYRRRKIEDLEQGKMLIGHKRKAIGAQVALHEREVESKFRRHDADRDGNLNAAELHSLMLDLNNGEPGVCYMQLRSTLSCSLALFLLPLLLSSSLALLLSSSLRLFVSSSLRLFLSSSLRLFLSSSLRLFVSSSLPLFLSSSLPLFLSSSLPLLPH
eukprot:SAG22_NODE_178_length_16142_cov_13.187995_14_plen_281_part_00